jgi:hypothetical protein
MEDLNKNQIILLTLLVSFVTSIATGIMTTSLLQQAPVEVTRNINRIVERTVETVTPANVLSAGKQVTTIVVNEDDSVTSAINKNTKSIVRIKEQDGVVFGTNFYALGMVVSKDGLIATDRKNIIFTNLYTGVMSDGTEFKLIPMGVDKKTNFILFKVNLPVDTKYNFTPVVFAEGDLKLGQTVVSIGGDVSNAVSVGRITILKDSSVGTTTPKTIINIATDVSANDIVDGAVALNLSGEVVGVRLGNDWSKTFTPISVLKKELPTLRDF